MVRFTEVQRFRQWWLILLLLISSSISSVVYVAIYVKSPEASFDIFGFALSIVVPAIVMTGFLFMKLEISIDKAGINYRFVPFHRNARHIDWQDIASAEIRKYNPIGEYGGWGLRSSGKFGKAYNVSGDVGLQIVLKNGSKILFGTQRGEEMKKVLKAIEDL